MSNNETTGGKQEDQTLTTSFSSAASAPMFCLAQILKQQSPFKEHVEKRKSQSTVQEKVMQSKSGLVKIFACRGTRTVGCQHEAK